MQNLEKNVFNLDCYMGPNEFCDIHIGAYKLQNFSSTNNVIE